MDHQKEYQLSATGMAMVTEEAARVVAPILVSMVPAEDLPDALIGIIMEAGLHGTDRDSALEAVRMSKEVWECGVVNVKTGCVRSIIREVIVRAASRKLQELEALARKG